MGWAVAMKSSFSALLLRSGMVAIRSLKSACSDRRTARVITGEDVKEYYFYLDSTPTHSYMKCL